MAIPPRDPAPHASRLHMAPNRCPFRLHASHCMCAADQVCRFCGWTKLMDRADGPSVWTERVDERVDERVWTDLWTELMD